MALRLATGWHFFKEGSKKFTGDRFTSLYFLQAAKGPLAETYKSNIPDRFGLDRLNVERTAKFWATYKDDVASRLNFDLKQTKAAESVVEKYTERLRTYLVDNADAMSEYRLEVARLQAAAQEKTREIPFQRDRIAAKEAELRGKSASWLKDLESLNTSLQDELNRLGTDAQRSRGIVLIPDRSKPAVDDIVKWLVFGSGVLLLIGLLTRLAAAGAMFFLLSVMASQPPWAAGADLTYFYYQLVEVMALFVLIVFAAGRFAGLDYVVHGMWQRCCPPKP